MNSIIEVSPKIIAILGYENNSEFRLNQLRQSIQIDNAGDIETQEIYFCMLNRNISSIKENELLLGTWQGIYLFEHRLNPTTRTVVHHFVGE